MNAAQRQTIDDRLVGTVIGRYRVKQVLDRGGMGAVYLAEHMLIGKSVVIKLLRPDLSHHEEMVARFFNEARAASAIRHPGVIEVFDFGHHSDGRAFIVMEHLDGHSLAHRLRRRGRLGEQEAAAIARSIAGVLASAHAAGVVHRDLKPDNVFLVPDPDASSGERVKVLDFGIAKLEGIEASKTRTGAVMGTPLYMSPEQARGAGAVDARADLYSLGCVLYHMITGRPPFVADGEGELIAMHLYSEPRPLRELVPAVSPALERVTMALLEKDPSTRTQTADELVEALAPIAGAVAAPILLRDDAQIAPSPSVTTPVAPSAAVVDGPLDAWFADSEVPVPASRVPSVFDSIAPVEKRSRRWWIVPAIAASVAAAMVTFALVRSVRDAGKDLDRPHVVERGQPGPMRNVIEDERVVAASSDTSFEEAPPAPPPETAVEEAAPPAPAPKPAAAPASKSHAAANRKPARAHHPKPTTTSSPNGSPLEPDI